MKEGDRVVVVSRESPYYGLLGTVTRLRPRPTSDDAFDVLLDGDESSTLFQPYEIVELIEEDDA